MKGWKRVWSHRLRCLLLQGQGYTAGHLLQTTGTASRAQMIVTPLLQTQSISAVLVCCCCFFFFVQNVKTVGFKIQPKHQLWEMHISKTGLLALKDITDLPGAKDCTMRTVHG